MLVVGGGHSCAAGGYELGIFLLCLYMIETYCASAQEIGGDEGIHLREWGQT
jgi:hypothetical protein